MRHFSDRADRNAAPVRSLALERPPKDRGVRFCDCMRMRGFQLIRRQRQYKYCVLVQRQNSGRTRRTRGRTLSAGRAADYRSRVEIVTPRAG